MKQSTLSTRHILNRFFSRETSTKILFHQKHLKNDGTQNTVSKITEIFLIKVRGAS